MKLSNKYQIFLILICLVFFYPFVLQGKIPLPADTIVGMYHPWRDVVWDDFQAGVPFKNYLITDPVRQQYPWKQLTIEQYKKIQWPLWNPYTHSGMPLLANFQTGAFYPLNLIFFVFPFNFAWGVYIFFQPILGCLFMYWFLRQKRLRPIACVLSSLVFSFGGFFTAWLEWGNIGHTILWLPLILLSIEKLLFKKNSLWPFVFIFSLSFQFFAGHLQTSFYVIIFSLIYLVFRLFSIKKQKKRVKCFLLFTFYFLLFTLITAVQWLPTLELIKNSAREIDQVEVLLRSDWFLPFKHLVQLIVPDFFGNPTTLNYWGEWNYGEFVSYVGIIPLFFILISAFQFKKNRLVKFFWLSTLLALSFALPTPWAKLPFLLKLPLIGSVQPSRLIGLVDFCLAVLSAFGLNKFLVSKKALSRDIILSLFSMPVLIGGLWFFVFQGAKFWPAADWLANLPVSQRNLILPTVFLGILLLLVVANKFVNSKIVILLFLGNICPFLFIFFTAFDLFRFSWKFNSFSPQDWVFPKTETVKFLQSDNSLFRFMTVDRRIFPSNFAIAYKLQTISGYDPLYLKDYASLVTKMESGCEEIASFNRIIEPANYQSEIADRLNVKYTLSLQDLQSEKLVKVFQEGETRIYENKNNLSRIQLIPEDKGDEIIVSNYCPNGIELEVKASREKDLVLADNFCPGWQAKVNGEKIEMEKTNENFRRIKVPQGKSSVQFFYFPSSFKIGLILTLVGLILSVFFVKKLPVGVL